MIKSVSIEDLRSAVRKHWGFDTFRPLQEEAVTAALNRRDSIVVIPTGGGKSLCYQAPAALVHEGLTLVVSPLIALMKDQVDALRARGIASAIYNSSLSWGERRDVTQGLAARRYRLLYVAPERLPDADFIDVIRSAGVHSVAIDEAHCISHWGHDFRPDYRRLKQLRDWFPDVAIHAFTATATPRVRDDIVEQLGLRDPAVLVGDFDRPNLTYRVQWRSRIDEQVTGVIDRYRGSAGIVYCIRRLDVDEMSAVLKSRGYRALPYHAGLAPEVRKDHQDAFSAGRADIIVATVAFGMGIDRPDIRFIVHAGMPKSVEAYQQETGRAGRDGLPAECALFYTGSDFMTWKSIMEKNESEHLDAHLGQLREMLDYCQSTRCRHQLLVEHFGQTYGKSNCEACDACVDARPTVADSTTVAMKILSAVVRTGERFGAKYVAEVLTGMESENVIARGHANLSVFGLMREHDARNICSWIDQLAAGGFLAVGQEYRTFSVTPKGRELLRGGHEVALVIQSNPRSNARRSRGGARQSVARAASVEPDSTRRSSRTMQRTSDAEDPLDAALFESLRALRTELAAAANLPAYCVFSNKTLEHIARAKPTNERAILAIPGIGPKKWAQYGQSFLDCVRTHIGA